MVDLFDSQVLGATVALKNRIVMAPMTRTRTSEDDVPNDLMATYYGQRAGAGLIVTEATDVAPSSKGYALTPGIHTDAQRQGWRLVTDEVHRKGGTIFMQIWHVGRMAHPSLMPDGEAPWGVTEDRAEHSDVFAHGADGRLGFIRAGTPRRLGTDDVSALVGTFAQAFANARQAGFDGVEIHGANGYLFDQFMNSALNTRTDRYGGGRVEDRTRFLMEVVDAAVRELGPGRVGVRLSPFGKYNSMPADPLAEETLLYVCEQLGRRGVAYLHLVYQLMPAGNMESSEFKERHIDHAVLAKVRRGVSRHDHLVRRLHRPRERPVRARHRAGGPDRLRPAIHRQPGPCRATQARLAAGRSGPVDLLHPAWRRGLHGLPGLFERPAPHAQADRGGPSRHSMP